MFKPSPEVIQTAIFIAVVVFGAIVHATAQLKLSREKKMAFDRTDFLILFVIASFSGMVFGLTSMLFFNNEIIVILFSAIGAFLGIAGLNRLSLTLLDVLLYKASKGNENDKNG
jgi:cation transport ATPase